MDGHERPADVLLHHWVSGKDGAVDITVTHPLQLSEHPLSPEKALGHCRRDEGNKLRKNEPLCQRAGWECSPFGMHCWAGLGPSAGALLHQIVKRATSAMSGWPKAKRALEIKQSLSFALMQEVGRQLEAIYRIQDC